jgi:hypothetical protein
LLAIKCADRANRPRHHKSARRYGCVPAPEKNGTRHAAVIRRNPF